MYPIKFRVFSKLLGSIFQPQDLLPKYQCCRINRCFSKACNAFNGIQSVVFKEHQKSQWNRKRVQFVHARVDLIKNLTLIDERLANCKNPVQKYDYLMTLRETDVNLYYRYLCDNFVELFTVICAANGIVHNFGRMGSIFLSRRKTKCETFNSNQLENFKTVTNLCKFIRAISKITDKSSETKDSLLLGQDEFCENCCYLRKTDNFDYINLRNMTLKCGNENSKGADQRISEEREEERKELLKCLLRFEDIEDYVRPYRRPYVS